MDIIENQAARAATVRAVFNRALSTLSASDPYALALEELVGSYGMDEAEALGRLDACVDNLRDQAEEAQAEAVAARAAADDAERYARRLAEDYERCTR